MPDNLTAVATFFAALQRRDTAPIADLLTDDVVEVLPLAASGRPEPAATFTGREAVLNVQNTIVEAFSVIEFREPRTTISADGNTVFVESPGRRVQRETGRVYENTYLLKFEFERGLIRAITEYSNPVAFALFFDQPIG